MKKRKQWERSKYISVFREQNATNKQRIEAYDYSYEKKELFYFYIQKKNSSVSNGELDRLI